MNKIILTLFLFFNLLLRSQNCSTLIKYDYIETYTWVGLWFGNTLNEGYYNNASVSATNSAVVYGSGGGASAIEQDWYTLPNVTGLNPSYTYEFRFRLGSYTFTNSTATTRGVDAADLVEVQVSTNGEISYTSEIRITGNNNATWDYNTNGVITKTANGTLTTYSPTAGGNRTTTGDGYSVIKLTMTGISQLAVDILCRVNANGEEWWLDNMELYEITPCPLPVELIYFNGVSEVGFNVIKWGTLTELNNSHFNLERSEDGLNWYSIDRIVGFGNSYQKIDYEFKDFTYVIGKINYYRLKQFDYNGDYEYSNIISVDNIVVKKLIKLISLEGKEVDENYRGFVIECYDDGSYKKKIQY